MPLIEDNLYFGGMVLAINFVLLAEASVIVAMVGLDLYCYLKGMVRAKESIALKIVELATWMLDLGLILGLTMCDKPMNDGRFIAVLYVGVIVIKMVTLKYDIRFLNNEKDDNNDDDEE